MTIVYGVDTDQPIRPVEVRDALIECFTQAHSAELSDLKKDDLFTEEEAEKAKHVNVQALIQGYFYNVGGDFEDPSKDDLLKVMEKLKTFAAKFRNQEIIQTHANEMMQLINKLP